MATNPEMLETNKICFPLRFFLGLPSFAEMPDSGEEAGSEEDGSGMGRSSHERMRARER